MLLRSSPFGAFHGSGHPHATVFALGHHSNTVAEDL